MADSLEGTVGESVAAWRRRGRRSAYRRPMLKDFVSRGSKAFSFNELTLAKDTDVKVLVAEVAALRADVTRLLALVEGLKPG